MSQQQYAQANVELEQRIWEALDRIYEGTWTMADLQLLAWQTGCSDWRPNDTTIRRTAGVG